MKLKILDYLDSAYTFGEGGIYEIISKCEISKYRIPLNDIKIFRR